MFSNQIKEAKEGIKRSQGMQNYRRQLFVERYLEPGEVDSLTEDFLAQKYAPDIRRDIGYWRNRESAYREALGILKELQREYREQFPWWKSWLVRDGHYAKLGLRLKARTRLSALEERVLNGGESKS